MVNRSSGHLPHADRERACSRWPLGGFSVLDLGEHGALRDGGTRLDGNGSPPFGATTILVLGTDQRPKGSKEPGANTSGPSRADSIVRTQGHRWSGRCRSSC